MLLLVKKVLQFVSFLWVLPSVDFIHFDAHTYAQTHTHTHAHTQNLENSHTHTRPQKVRKIVPCGSARKSDITSTYLQERTASNPQSNKCQDSSSYLSFSASFLSSFWRAPFMRGINAEVLCPDYHSGIYPTSRFKNSSCVNPLLRSRKMSLVFFLFSDWFWKTSSLKTLKSTDTLENAMIAAESGDQHESPCRGCRCDCDISLRSQWWYKVAQCSYACAPMSLGTEGYGTHSAVLPKVLLVVTSWWKDPIRNQHSHVSQCMLSRVVMWRRYQTVSARLCCFPTLTLFAIYRFWLGQFQN